MELNFEPYVLGYNIWHNVTMCHMVHVIYCLYFGFNQCLVSPGYVAWPILYSTLCLPALGLACQCPAHLHACSLIQYRSLPPVPSHSACFNHHCLHHHCSQTVRPMKLKLVSSESIFVVCEINFIFFPSIDRHRVCFLIFYSSVEEQRFCLIALKHRLCLMCRVKVIFLHGQW